MTDTPAAPTRPRTHLTQTLLLTFALPDFYADDLTESADYYDGDLTEAFYNEAGLISSTARLSIMSGDKGGNDLHSMRAVLVNAAVEDRVSAHDDPEDERLTEALIEARSTPAEALDAARRAIKAEISMASDPEGKDQFEKGALAAYHFALAVLSPDGEAS